MMSEGLAECKWIRGFLESAVHRDYDSSLHRDDLQFNFLPIVTFMKANNTIHLDPPIVCIVNATSALDHLIRESFWAVIAAVRLIADTTKRHGNSVTTLKFFKRSTLSI